MPPPKTYKYGRPFNELTDAMVDAYARACGEKYLWHGEKDSNALKRLLGVADFSLILARWEWALKRSGYNSARTISELALKWQAIAAACPLTFKQQPSASSGTRRLN